jgi:hypothetical protein
MLTMTLAACSANPTGPAPQSVQPSLLLVGSIQATGVIDATGRTCGVTTDDARLVISGSSTYIVAYGDKQPDCGASAVDTTSVEPVAEPLAPPPAPRLDTLGLKLSF